MKNLSEILSLIFLAAYERHTKLIPQMRLRALVRSIKGPPKKLDMRYNPMSLDEDITVPSGVTVLRNGIIGTIGQINHVPKSYQIYGTISGRISSRHGPNTTPVPRPTGKSLFSFFDPDYEAWKNHTPAQRALYVAEHSLSCEDPKLLKKITDDLIQHYPLDALQVLA